MASIEQLAQKIAAMKAEHVKDIEQAIRDEYAVELPEVTPQTCSAEEAWEKMEQGWVVADGGGARWHMDGVGHVWVSYGWKTHANKVQWCDLDGTFTLHGIHPGAHEYALQRHLAAGMKVGSRVEVVDREWIDNDGGCTAMRGFALVGCTGAVSYIDGLRVAVRVDESGAEWVYPAHCLRLIEAEPEADPAPYTPPCKAELHRGDACGCELQCRRWNPFTGRCEACGSRYTSKLPAPPKPREWKVGDRAWVEVTVEWEAGDRVWVEAVVERAEPDDDGDIRLKVNGRYYYYAKPSALRPVGQDGGGE